MPIEARSSPGRACGKHRFVLTLFPFSRRRAMSSSSSSDSDAMAVDVAKSTTKDQSKTKPAAKRASKAERKAKSRATVDTSDDESSSEEEGVAYRAPTGFKPLNIEVDAEFDWDAVSADPNAELWLIRVPDGFKSKQLDGLSLRNGRGTISRKSGTATHLVAPADEQADEEASLRCLLPRKRKGGKLYLAPKPVARHLVVTQVPATPTVDLTSRCDERTRTKRPEWPAAMLKHRFEPCGAKGVQAAAMEDSSVPVAASDDEMDEDDRPARKKVKVDSPEKGAGESAKKKHKHKKDARDDDNDETAEDNEKRRKEKEEKREKKRKAAEAAETPGSTKKSKKVKIA
ncbi:hypothetical protein AURDEDRAFT_162121 [Auricularia subglabra TFB-10046 SS5]|nr:hypothetical protein AURDEDRAFT_162121 [Auricularia subglabra TFB-10046 SS5]